MRSSLIAASTWVTFANFSAPSPIDRSMASRRASGVSSARIFTTSRDTAVHSASVRSNSGHRVRSSPLAVIAVYFFQRPAT